MAASTAPTAPAARTRCRAEDWVGDRARRELRAAAAGRLPGPPLSTLWAPPGPPASAAPRQFRLAAAPVRARPPPGCAAPAVAWGAAPGEAADLRVTAWRPPAESPVPAVVLVRGGAEARRLRAALARRVALRLAPPLLPAGEPPPATGPGGPLLLLRAPAFAAATREKARRRAPRRDLEPLAADALASLRRTTARLGPFAAVAGGAAAARLTPLTALAVPLLPLAPPGLGGGGLLAVERTEVRGDAAVEQLFAAARAHATARDLERLPAAAPGPASPPPSPPPSPTDSDDEEEAEAAALRLCLPLPLVHAGLRRVAGGAACAFGARLAAAAVPAAPAGRSPLDDLHGADRCRRLGRALAAAELRPLSAAAAALEVPGAPDLYRPPAAAGAFISRRPMHHVMIDVAHAYLDWSLVRVGGDGGGALPPGARADLAVFPAERLQRLGRGAILGLLAPAAERRSSGAPDDREPVPLPASPASPASPPAEAEALARGTRAGLRYLSGVRGQIRDEAAAVPAAAGTVPAGGRVEALDQPLAGSFLDLLQKLKFDHDEIILAAHPAEVLADSPVRTEPFLAPAGIAQAVAAAGAGTAPAGGNVKLCACLALRQAAIGLMEYGVRFAHLSVLHQVQQDPDLLNLLIQSKNGTLRQLAAAYESVEHNNMSDSVKHKPLKKALVTQHTLRAGTKSLVLVDLGTFFTVVSTLFGTGLRVLVFDKVQIIEVLADAARFRAMLARVDVMLMAYPTLDEHAEILKYFQAVVVYSRATLVGRDTRPTADLAARAGCHAFVLGVEPGDPGLLEPCPEPVVIPPPQPPAAAAVEARPQCVAPAASAEPVADSRRFAARKREILGRDRGRGGGLRQTVTVSKSISISVGPQASDSPGPGPASPFERFRSGGRNEAGDRSQFRRRLDFEASRKRNKRRRTSGTAAARPLSFAAVPRPPAGLRSPRDAPTAPFPRPPAANPAAAGPRFAVGAGGPRRCWAAPGRGGEFVGGDDFGAHHGPGLHLGGFGRRLAAGDIAGGFGPSAPAASRYAAAAAAGDVGVGAFDDDPLMMPGFREDAGYAGPPFAPAEAPLGYADDPGDLHGGFPTDGPLPEYAPEFARPAALEGGGAPRAYGRRAYAPGPAEAPLRAEHRDPERSFPLDAADRLVSAIMRDTAERPAANFAAPPPPPWASQLGPGGGRLFAEPAAPAGRKRPAAAGRRWAQPRVAKRRF